MNWFFSEINFEDNPKDLDKVHSKFASQQIISLKFQSNEITNGCDEILSSFSSNHSCISSLQIHLSASENDQIFWR